MSKLITTICCDRSGTPEGLKVSGASMPRCLLGTLLTTTDEKDGVLVLRHKVLEQSMLYVTKSRAGALVNTVQFTLGRGP